MDIKKTLRVSASIIILLLIGYFYSQEFRANWTSLRDFKFILNIGYLVLSLSLFLLSFLLETYIWKVCINKHLGRNELDFFQSIAVVNSSGLLKYLPGRIWTYTAQLVWLKKYDISKAIILYVNLICILGSLVVSLYLGLIYVALYTNVMGLKAVIFSTISLILLNTMYIAWNAPLVNKLITLANRLFKREIQPLNSSGTLILFIQLVYACSWVLAGFAGYVLAEGVGLHVPATSIFAVLASMSLSWIVGYLAVITPGGLGIREGMMLMMLNNIVNAQTAIILPLLSRIMYLITEALLGVTALLLGVKYKVFSAKNVD